jgi:hypothetical protein
MRILNEEGPMWKKLQEYFDFDTTKTVYTYGDILYNPAGVDVDMFLMIHEMRHEAQQRTMGVEKWWDKYLADAVFRAQQEAEAYGAQYRAYCEMQQDRNARERYLHRLYVHMASGMYKLSMHSREARAAILNFSHT